MMHVNGIATRSDDVGRDGPRDHVRRTHAGHSTSDREGPPVPHHAGRLPDEGRPGAGHLRRQGEEPAQPRRRRTSTRRPREDRRICDWIGEVADVDFLAADSEVDALLLEARLIKDIQPKHNQDLKDDKSFPYLQITHRRGLSPGQVHPRAARPRRQALRPVPAGARACAGRSRCCSGSSSSAPARSTSRRTTPAGAGFAPACCTRSTSAPPPATSGSTARITASDIRRLRLFLDGKKDVVLREMEEEMQRGQQGAAVREGRPAARRDQGAPDARTSAATSPSTPSPRSSTSIPAKG